MRNNNPCEFRIKSIIYVKNGNHETIPEYIARYECTLNRSFTSASSIVFQKPDGSIIENISEKRMTYAVRRIEEEKLPSGIIKEYNHWIGDAEQKGKNIQFLKATHQARGKSPALFHYINNLSKSESYTSDGRTVRMEYLLKNILQLPSDREAYAWLSRDVKGRTVKQMILQDPQKRLVYDNLYMMGFRDPNALQMLLYEVGDDFFYESYDFTEATDSIFKENASGGLAETEFKFLMNIRTVKGDTRAAQLLFKERLGTSDEWRMHYHDLLKGYATLNQEEASQVVRMKSIKEMHNSPYIISASTKIKNDADGTKAFIYDSDDKMLEDEMEGFRFCLSSSPGELAYISNTFHNCVYRSYTASVIDRTCIIVLMYDKETNQAVGCLEVRRKKIEEGTSKKTGYSLHQAKTHFNRRLNAKEAYACWCWAEKHGLNPSESYDLKYIQTKPEETATLQYAFEMAKAGFDIDSICTVCEIDAKHLLFLLECSGMPYITGPENEYLKMFISYLKNMDSSNGKATRPSFKKTLDIYNKNKYTAYNCPDAPPEIDLFPIPTAPPFIQDIAFE